MDDYFDFLVTAEEEREARCLTGPAVARGAGNFETV